MVAARWEHFHHLSDIGVRGLGPTAESAFEQAAVALVAVITRPEGVKESQEVKIECSAPDLELLLVDWLNALIYQMGTRRMLFRRFQVRLQAETLQASAWGEDIDRTRHTPAVEIKGATYTELQVAQQPDGEWIAQCVVDV
ncbi:MAG: archease [Gammaproteobacteria bacterium]|nr:archease [Gammaproteobacteria bacterium]